MLYHNGPRSTRTKECYSWFDIRIHLRRYALDIVALLVSHCFNVMMPSARTLPFTPGVNEYHTGGVRSSGDFRFRW
jgi:hypothetical protein